MMNRRRPLAKTPKMTFNIVTLFPEALDSYVKASIVGRAITDGYITVTAFNPRDYSDDKWQRVDRAPYGGGPGMVLEALPVIKAIEAAKGRAKNSRVIFLTPRGRQFTTEVATEYAAAAIQKKGAIKNIVFVCGRYEGIDARVREAIEMEEVSIGPFVLTGGELAALAIVDSTIRQVPGILGNFDSREEARASTDWVYTRPEVFIHKKKKYLVPPVLLSGNHKNIDEWRAKGGKHGEQKTETKTKK